MEQCPYLILIDKAPFCSELDYQLTVDGFEFWRGLSFEEVIYEIEELESRYYPDSGWDVGWSIENEVPEVRKAIIKEHKEVKAVLRHVKKVYNKIKGETK